MGKLGREQWEVGSGEKCRKLTDDESGSHSGSS